MERLPQSDSEDPTRARPAVPRFAALLLIPALLLFALLLVRPEPSKLREGVPVEASALWKRGAPPGGPGKAPRKPKVRKPKKPQPQEPPMGGSSESGSEPPAEPTEVEVTWNTISGKPIPFKHKPRVRREWRTLSLEMKNKVARAFWQVKTVKTLEGRKIYGKHFNNHDDMLILHSCATTDPRCDEGHFGPQFMTFHRALLLKYELSLLSVDPTIEAMPYWNMAYDAKDGKYRHDPEKYIFTNNYFGNYTGTGANYMVIDGLFANFPVTEWTSERFGNKSYMAKDNKCIREEWFKGTKPSVCDRCCVTHCSDCRDTSPDVYTTRLRLHDDCSPYVARWPMDPDALGPLGGTYDLVYSEEDFAACHDVKVVRSWMEWQDCIEMSTFMCGHRFGIVSGQPGFETVFKKRVLPEMKQRILATGDPKAFEALRKLDDAAQKTVDSFKNFILNVTKDLCGDYMLYGYLRQRNFLGKKVEPKLPHFFHSQAHIKFGKDLLDVTTSPNEAAAFTGYHSDIDRNSMTWMINAQAANPAMGLNFWQYPATQHVTPDQVIKTEQQGLGRGISGPFAIYDVMACSNNSAYDEYHFGESPYLPGTLLDEVVNSGFAFKDLFDCDGEEAKSAPPGISCDGGEKGYTHKEMLYWTSPERTPYTYDTLAENYY